jgi:hypothetical protein
MTVFNQFSTRHAQNTMEYSQFIEEVKRGARGQGGDRGPRR